MDYKYYYFGSANSTDRDVIVDHPDATGTEGDTHLIKELKAKFPICSNWDINIVKIKEGYIIKSIPSKGNVDSVNNSLFQTYHLHEQEYSQPLKGNIERHKLLAVVRCIRAILLSVKKTSQYKATIRHIMKGDFQGRIDALSSITFCESTFPTLPDSYNEFKRIAFRIGQTLSLMNGTEIYTKADFIANYPDLANIINRTGLPEPGQMEALILKIQNLAETMGIEQIGKDMIKWNTLRANYQSEEDVVSPV